MRIPPSTWTPTSISTPVAGSATDMSISTSRSVWVQGVCSTACLTFSATFSGFMAPQPDKTSITAAAIATISIFLFIAFTSSAAPDNLASFHHSNTDCPAFYIRLLFRRKKSDQSRPLALLGGYCTASRFSL